MLTNNFKKWLKTIVVDGRNVTNVWVKTISGKLIRLYGPAGHNIGDVSNDNEDVFFFATALARAENANFHSIYFGSGTSPVTREDYSLKFVDSSLSVQNTKFTGKDDSGRPYCKHVLLCTNVSSVSVTIAEIGYAPRMYGVDESGSNHKDPVLMDRTLLSSPVTLAPGESCSIDYSITNQFDI